jgi:hypothetical protein
MIDDPKLLISSEVLRHVKLTEQAFQGQVRHLAIVRGWLYYHTHDSRRSDKGFPDTVLIKGSRLVIAELKVGKRKTTREQETWLEAFRNVGAEVYVWRPDDWPEIVRVLA